MKILFLAIFSITVAQVFGADTIGKYYDLSKVTALVAVVKRYDNVTGEAQYFEPLKTKFEEPVELSKLCKSIEGSVAEDAGQGPFVGHLCHFVMFDRDQKILGMVSILNFNCLCDIHGAHRDAKGRIVADYEKKPYGFVSLDLAQAFYDRLKRDDPAYMKELDTSYAKAGKTVEGLLFGNRKGKQDSTGQPATRSESKSDAKENHNPEAEGRSR